MPLLRNNPQGQQSAWDQYYAQTRNPLSAVAPRPAVPYDNRSRGPLAPPGPYAGTPRGPLTPAQPAYGRPPVINQLPSLNPNPGAWQPPAPNARPGTPMPPPAATQLWERWAGANKGPQNTDRPVGINPPPQPENMRVPTGMSSIPSASDPNRASLPAPAGPYANGMLPASRPTSTMSGQAPLMNQNQHAARKAWGGRG